MLMLKKQILPYDFRRIKRPFLAEKPYSVKPLRQDCRILVIFFHLSPPRMKSFMQIFEVLAGDVGIYLGRRNVDMP